MARILMTGFETRVYTTSITTNGDAQSTKFNTAPEVDTTNQWAGSCCAKFPTAASRYFQHEFTHTTTRQYSLQFVIKWGTLTSGNNFFFLAKSATNIIDFELLTEGKINVKIGSAEKGNTIAPGLETEKHYIFELQWTQTGSLFAMYIRNEKGESIFYKDNFEGTLGTEAATVYDIGNVSAKAGITYLTQVILNDNTGTSELSWVGPQKVVLLKATSDNARTATMFNGAGGTTNLWKGVSTYAPAGVVNTSKTETTQVYSNTAAFDEYDANLAAYSTAVASGGGGMSGSDKIKVCMAIIRVGNSTVTARSCVVKGESNPVIAEVATSTSGTAETDPTGWRSITTGYVYEPTNALTAQPVVLFKKNVSVGDSVMCDMMALYVSFTPAAESSIPRRVPHRGLVMIGATSI